MSSPAQEEPAMSLSPVCLRHKRVPKMVIALLERAGSTARILGMWEEEGLGLSIRGGKGSGEGQLSA